jgi:hypothetical protein
VLAAPDLVDVETVAAAQALAGRTISEGRFAVAVRDLEDIDLERYPVLRG